ncbi:short chain dehydrogenase [Podospora appendiculata]|uniref:Short chain dehydrogenase n=1 Tax=Podospora appendiculata TaxID=314037 RepID=A0AAE0XIY2_9PEZI|nr:short chain dehydrogenase [Podospora appendiculata]
MAYSPYRKLQDKHVLVIGGSSGIGAGVAEAALASGAHVTISSSSQTKIDATVIRLAAAYPDRAVRGFAVDLSKPSVEADVDSLFQAAQAAQGTINHVVYTAADSLALGGLDTVTVDGIHKASHMRMVAPILMAKVASRYLPASNLSSLTLTSGVVAEKPAPGWSVISYFAGGLKALARALAVDLAPVRVNVVQPGYVETGLWDPMTPEAKAGLLKSVEGFPTGKIGKVEDVAEAYLWFLKDSNATGSVAGTDAGQLLV